MAKVSRPILLDASAAIEFLSLGVYGKVCKALGKMACVAEYVAKWEIRGYRDRLTKRWKRFDSSRITATSTPPPALPQGPFRREVREVPAILSDPGSRRSGRTGDIRPGLGHGIRRVLQG